MKSHSNRILIPSRRLFIGGGLLLLLIIGVWVIGRQLSAPAHSPVLPSQSAAHKTTITVPTAVAQSITNSYYTLNLPAGYIAHAAETPSTGLLYTQTIIKPSTLGSLIIAIGIKTLPEGGLAGDTSYNLRLSNSSRFSLSSRQVHGDTVQLATDLQQTSVVAFWQHVGLLATISISSGLGNQTDGGASELTQALTPLLEAWQWQQ